MHAIVPPLSLCGPVLNVRKFSAVAFTPTDLVGGGTLGSRMLAFLSACVRGRANIVIRFHDLRHTYATLARRGGMDIKDLSVRLGHEDVATTMNLYQHIPLDMARESAQNVADYILG